MNKKLLIMFTLFAVLVAALSSFFYFKRRTSPRNEASQNAPEILVEKIPGSKNHSPDGTWWGYNQQKIVRYKGKVFSYFIDNDDDPGTPSKFTILMKDGDSKWQKGTSLLTSRPGNILMDSKGVLHAFVFEATNMLENDSVGALIRYTFANAKDGDITNYVGETVIGAKDDVETVNIRIGAAIAPDDTMAIAFGVTVDDSNLGQTEQIYYKKAIDTKWTKEIIATRLGHDFYYPFVAAENNSFSLLPVQDDFVAAGAENIYQMILYLEGKSANWEKEMIADLSGHGLAKERRGLLEQSDLFIDSAGTTHVIYKEFLDPKDNAKASIKHLIKKDGESEWAEQAVKNNYNLNWVRLTEINGELYYFALSYSDLYYKKYGDDKFKKIGDLPKSSNGSYLYLATKKSGTKKSDFIDLLLLNGDSSNYPNAENYYVRIPVEEIKR